MVQYFVMYHQNSKRLNLFQLELFVRRQDKHTKRGIAIMVLHLVLRRKRHFKLYSNNIDIKPKGKRQA
jgi:hypothetical protein